MSDDTIHFRPTTAHSPHAVAVLLSHHDRATIVSSSTAVPRRIAGRYEIKHLIGSGGMGEVYEAWQDQPGRIVAIKIMRVAVPTPEALRRFEYESQLLAKLRHPSIAQVYDAGAYADPASGSSLPYFVMEFVPGAMPLTAFANDNKLSLAARLDLFLRVCDAVGHAHQRGVIHRDLKPANILIDNTGTPKVIDFGIASSSDGDTRSPDTGDSAPIRIIGTLEYMPPEQCSWGGAGGEPGRAGEAGGKGEVDIRADIYALGVTLYELLTSHMPYDLTGRNSSDATRVICEVDPPPPSTHSKQLGVDLDAIILKSLKKMPAERYDSAPSFAADIKRYLAHEPILARRVGVPGRLVRWGRRNRGVATAIGISGVVLIITSVLLIGQILRESDRANTNLAESQRNLVAAKENLALITGLFGSLKPDELDRGRVDVEHLLDSAALRLANAPPKLPETEASFREFLAEAYRGIGIYAKAIGQQRRVVELRETLSTAPGKPLADSLHNLGAALWWNGDTDEARKIYARSLDMRRHLYGIDHADIATSLTHLAACDLRMGRLIEAQDLYTQALNMRQRLVTGSSPEVAASYNNLAKCVQLLGDTAGAEELFRTSLEMITQTKGDSDLQTASAAHNLASCLLERGLLDEAAARFQQALTIRTTRLGANHHLVASSRLGLARANFKKKPDPEFLAQATQSLDVLEQRLPADHPDVADASTSVGNMLVELGQYEKAERLFRTALSIRKDARRTAAWELVQSQLLLGECLAFQGKNDEAEKLLRQSMEGSSTNESLNRYYVKARTSLAALYDTLNRPEEAKRVRGAVPKRP